jgi:hypothetical protein
MYDPWLPPASKLAREREIYRRYVIACQLREVKAKHRRRRQRQLRSWVSSLGRCVCSPLAAYWRWSGREDRKPETMQFLEDRLERGTPAPAAPPDTVAAVSVSRCMRQYGDQDSGGWQ